MIRLAAAILLVLLAACGELIDADEARLCRMTLPAINDAARLDIQQTRPGPYPFSLRINYRAIGADGAIQARFVICRFSAERGARSQRDLTGLATEFGPMADASFFFLKRFYLDAPAAGAADRAPPSASASLPEVPLWLAYGRQQLLMALPSAAIYALLAAAYALIYGLMGRFVLVFGEFAALGGLAGIVGLGAVAGFGVETALAGVMVALVIGVASAALHGFVLSRTAPGRLARQPGQHVLIATVGAGIVLTEFLRLTQGAEMRWVPPLFNQPIPLMRAGDFVTTMTSAPALAVLVGLLATLCLLAFMQRSPYGRAWRAVADDAGMAALCGVSERAVLDKALILAAALAGLAGIIVTALYGDMGFAGGFSLGLKALIAAILGGIGSITGAVLGGLAVAAFEAIWSATMPIERRELVIHAALVVVLVFRPGGLFGFPGLGPWRV